MQQEPNSLRLRHQGLVTDAIFESKSQITLSILTKALTVPQSIADHYAVHSLPHLTLAILAGRTEFPLVQTSELDRHEIRHF